MSLVDKVRVARRFLRSIRIDTDLGDYRALDGYICTQTTRDVLLVMARHVSDTGQGAFTWTGPYGGGKSSLAMGLAALLSTDDVMRQEAERIFDGELCHAIRNAFPLGERGWKTLPIVGWRGDPINSLGEALRTSNFIARRPRGGWTEKNLIHAFQKSLLSLQDHYGGLIVFVDEMGKFLEAAARQGTDVYFFQQLAEMSSRSQGKLIVVGILHQAFDEYASKLAREQRDEWAKIQGRFIDLTVSATGDEQVELISQAIETNSSHQNNDGSAKAVALLLNPDNHKAIPRLTSTLSDCWPLHPVVALLLGPISRRRFGQNQRSIFGFLNSAEPYGFQYFLSHADYGNVYCPDQLWDYLSANLEPSILASPDGHRWALAAETLERCEFIGGNNLHLRLLKTIAVIDLFKERSGLVASLDLLKTCLSEYESEELCNALSKLSTWSLILFRKYASAYAIFAGSDFDIDEAIRKELPNASASDFDKLQGLVGTQPLVAKRHYHETGALRWFEINFAPLEDVSELSESYTPTRGAIGQFVLAIPTEGESDENAATQCRIAAQYMSQWDTVVGYCKSSWTVSTLARELSALESISNEHPSLAGDAVARREVNARLADLQSQVESEIQRSLDTATWYGPNHSERSFKFSQLNSYASDLADERYCKSPKLRNELLNRDKPSGSAIAAQNALLRRMVLNSGENRLGICGYPGEGGLLASLLHAPQLYRYEQDSWKFAPPSDSDPCRLKPIWSAATEYVRANADRAVEVAEIYTMWRAQPFGVKDGLMSVLAVAFIQSNIEHLAIYREGVFRAEFDDVDVEYLAKDARSVQIRWMVLSDLSRRLLSGMAEVVRALTEDAALIHPEPIDVARGLVAIYDRLPNWTKRTMQLSDNAVRFREIFKRARDPNQFLFSDLPSVELGSACTREGDSTSNLIGSLKEGLEEMVLAYTSMLHRLRDTMLSELQVPNLARQSLVELRLRARNVQRVAGDFRVEAFIGRIALFDGSNEAFEGIASLIANKPPRDWVDSDFDRSLLEIAEMAQHFLRVELLARVKGRPQKRNAMAVIVGLNGRPTPILEEFDVGDGERAVIDDLMLKIQNVLDATDSIREGVILAALANLSLQYMTGSNAAVQLASKELNSNE